MKPLLLLLWPAIACCSNYYVDFNAGSNSADGLTPATAWKNLWVVNLSKFAPGDYILLKRGSYWNETLAIRSAGTVELPITVDAYGSGDNPVIDGTGLALSSHMGVVMVNRPYLSLKNLDVRNSPQDGVNVDNVEGFTLSNSSLHDNQANGIYTWNASTVKISASSIYNNAQDTGASWAGIGIDGSARMNSILIEGCSIYNNTGGSDVDAWNAGNGISIGNTANEPQIAGLVIRGNEIYSNGNKTQNQMGRGISAAFSGDILITQNHIYGNASAGAYIGKEGDTIAIVISFNEFRNNALRQFGGFTDGSANCFNNTMIVDQADITGMGAEVGGSGPWILSDNTFLYKAATSDTFRGYITLNDAAQEAVFQGSSNLFYSVPGSPERWRMSNGAALTFNQWKAAGYDGTSANPHGR